MDRWHHHIVRAERPDAVRQWADLEGKCPTTRDDLYRDYAAHQMPSRVKIRRIISLAELLAVALEVVWHSRR